MNVDREIKGMQPDQFQAGLKTTAGAVFHNLLCETSHTLTSQLPLILISAVANIGYTDDYNFPVATASQQMECCFLELRP